MSAILSGSWDRYQALPDAVQLFSELISGDLQTLDLLTDASFQWDSLFCAWLLKLQRHCDSNNIKLLLSGLPEDVQNLHQLAIAVPVENVSTKKTFFSLQSLQFLTKGVFQWLENVVLFFGRYHARNNQNVQVAQRCQTW